MKLKIEAFEIGCFLVTFSQSLAKKYMVIEWLSWLPNKNGIINFNNLETLKDSPNTPPSLKLLEQRVHELVGRSTDPPQRQRCGE